MVKRSILQRPDGLHVVLMNAELTTDLSKTSPRCYSAVMFGFVYRDLSVTAGLREYL
jgi:hypothetical protein